MFSPEDNKYGSTTKATKTTCGSCRPQARLQLAFQILTCLWIQSDRGANRDLRIVGWKLVAVVELASLC